MFTRRQPVDSARSSDSSSRMPPVQLDVDSDLCDHPSQHLGVRTTSEGGIEVYHVQPFGSLVTPPDGGGERIAELLLGAGDALYELDGLPSLHVNRWQQLQCVHEALP